MSKIIHRTMRQEAAQAIEEFILNGALVPGQRVTEQDMADRLGISRVPIREAFHQLEQNGLLEYLPNIGCSVRKNTPRDILEADMLRTHLELMALDLLGGVLPPKTLADIKTVVENMSSRGQEMKLSDVLAEDNAFHGLIVGAVGMERLLRLWQGIAQGSVTLLRRFEAERDPLLALHKKLHIDLLTALQTGKMEVIRPAMMRHCVEVVRLQVDNGMDVGFDLNLLLT